MVMTLHDEISQLLDLASGETPETVMAFRDRLEQGALTRDENTLTHFSTFFLPYNPQTKEVFLVHHKKAATWISPGGHIDRGEGLLATLNREISEELGIENHFAALTAPFLLTIKHIDSATHPCKTHYYIWFLMTTDGVDFKVDPGEFLDTKWLTLPEARKIVTDPPNVRALDEVEKL